MSVFFFFFNGSSWNLNYTDYTLVSETVGPSGLRYGGGVHEQRAKKVRLRILLKSNLYLGEDNKQLAWPERNQVLSDI